MFGDDEERLAGRGGLGAGDLEAAPGGGGGSGDLSGDRPEGVGVSLLQALTDLQADSGRNCTLVVMEYMDSGTLHTAIVRGDFSARRCPEQRQKLLALLLTAQELAQGMTHLHGLDILHGDLKPTNVLLRASPCQYSHPATGYACLDPRGYMSKIADLGLARTCPGETAALSSDQWGALAYLAPEAAKGSCCKASDVYSFGVMLWEMAAGVRPYLGLTTPQVLMGLVTGTLQLTWPSDGSLYPPLRQLAVACTDINPAERPTFEQAARLLGRMVRNVRAAGEPLRQRHSSALSMEVGRGGSTGLCTGPSGCVSPGPTTRLGGGGGYCGGAVARPVAHLAAGGIGSGGGLGAAADRPTGAYVDGAAAAAAAGAELRGRPDSLPSYAHLGVAAAQPPAKGV
ncbi:hypothetical protein GPECTOR_75g773 [Gonium pectorale]|uniref:Protein kinase domain-containing protein n=1 Tax=Gonium pectorale TaxID=33097 RepID=A0A150G2E7_GONPE|nr:hypothetical protein GPECTOR_75g773 [Gonium pectorale]|eukprot:KXZ44049.1 hypothetical protein GPECTOR_75g773 [Gonium pectorale]